MSLYGLSSVMGHCQLGLGALPLSAAQLRDMCLPVGGSQLHRHASLTAAVQHLASLLGTPSFLQLSREMCRCPWLMLLTCRHCRAGRPLGLAGDVMAVTSTTDAWTKAIEKLYYYSGLAALQASPNAVCPAAAT